jgi:hypothetical protein
MGKICLCCGEDFAPHPSRPDQQYCSKAGCQRERRRRWHRKKMESDAVYRQGQADCQKSWRDNHPDYWRRYRGQHPDYCERNRKRQRARNSQRQGRSPGTAAIAKMDELSACNHIESGKYILIPWREGIAKMDELIVQLAVIAGKIPMGVRAGP